MPPTSLPANPPPAEPARGCVWLLAAVLALAATLGYWNTFRAPFIFDDIPAIAENPSIRDLRRPSELLAPPELRGSGAAGRPVVNLTLAMNRALGGDDVRGYHVFNLLVHIGAGLAFFGVVRRTLGGRAGFSPLCEGAAREKGGLKTTLPRDATAMAFAVALLWLLHPLQTESVTCIIQRTEALAGLFVVFAFYCLARAAETNAKRWWAACFAACVLGAATKELVAMAPLLLLLYDRTFVAGSFRLAWARRWRFHVSLAMMTWWIVGLLILRSGVRGGTVGYGHGVAWWEYALTQCRAIVMYLKLSVWPHPLVLDYGTLVIREPLAVVPEGLLLVTLLVATGWALWRRPRLGFLGAWFFGILVPSSSVVPLVTQTMAEHRMYLPLAAVLTLVVVTLRAVTGSRGFVLGVAAGALGLVTVARNADYRSAENIWRDTVAKRPDNPRAHFSLAQLADDAGRSDLAIVHGEAAVRLLPDDATAHFNLAFSFAKAGRFDAAVRHYEQAARLRPDSPDALINLGAALARLGRLDEAVTRYEEVVRLRPDSAEDRFNLAQIYFVRGRWDDAVVHYMKALELRPDLPGGHHRLGLAQLKRNEWAAAENALREAVRLAPEQFEAHVNLAGALMMLNRPGEAVPVYERALALRPDHDELRANLAQARRLAAP